MSIESKISRLSLELKTSQSPRTSKSSSIHKKSQDQTQEQEPPESWEDDLEEEAEDTTPVEAPGPTLKNITSHDEVPVPPPPTPISPTLSAGTYSTREWAANTMSQSPAQDANQRTSNSEAGLRRPEKSTATAQRMIAGALGLRAPKKTEEQRQYERAVKESEIKRRNREKEQAERDKVEDQKAKDAVWG